MTRMPKPPAGYAPLTVAEQRTLAYGGGVEENRRLGHALTMAKSYRFVITDGTPAGRATLATVAMPDLFTGPDDVLPYLDIAIEETDLALSLLPPSARTATVQIGRHTLTVKTSNMAKLRKLPNVTQVLPKAPRAKRVVTT